MRVSANSACESMRSVMWCSIVLVIGICTAKNATAKPIVLAGSGTNLPAVRLLSQSFSRLHPGIQLEAPTNIGSDGAIRAVTDGAISIGLISRPLLGREKRLPLAVATYARSAVVIGVHPLVKDDGITVNEFNSIYRGVKTTWKDGQKIIVLNREPGESSIYVLEEGVPGFREVYADSIKNNRWSIILKDEGMNQKIQSLPNSIGFSDKGAIVSQKLKIKILKLNGVYPSVKNVLNNSYPLYKTLSFIYRPDKLTPAMQAFIAYACSSEGKKILSDSGYIPYCVPSK